MFEARWHAHVLRGYPALVDETDAVRVQVFSDEASARRSMAAGTRRLVLLGLPSRRQLVDQLERLLDNRAKLALAGLRGASYASARSLAEDVVLAAVEGPDEGRAKLAPRPRELCGPGLGRARRPRGGGEKGLAGRGGHHFQSGRARKALRGPPCAARPSLQASFDDVACELAVFAGPSFVSRAGLNRLPDVGRYVTALERRLEKLPSEPLT